MEPRFQAESKQDKVSYRNQVTANFVLHHKTPTPVFYGITVALAAFVWWGGVFGTGRTATPLVAVVYGAALLAAAIVGAPYMDWFAVKRVSARMLRSTLKKVKDLGAELHLTFWEDQFILDTPTAHAERAYTVLTALCETPTHFLMFQGKDFCFAFIKTGISGGSVEELRTFLEEKSGRKVQAMDV